VAKLASPQTPSQVLSDSGAEFRFNVKLLAARDAECYEDW